MNKLIFHIGRLKKHERNKGNKICLYCALHSDVLFNISSYWPHICIDINHSAGSGGCFSTSTASTILGILLTLAVAIIIIFPVGSFLLSILSSFLLALVYNLLVPRVGGIKLEMLDMKEIISMPVIPLSLMLSAVYTILTFLIMLIVAPLMMLIIQGAAIAP